MRRLVIRVSLVLVTLTVAGVGLRAFINSRFPLFGDSIHRVDTRERVVALTFDDGPHPRHTPRMLDLLDRHQVKATFFMMGRNVERHPDVVLQVLARGHEVGNHSYSHPRLVFMAPGRVRHEISRTDALLRSLGVTGDIHFSPPHGSKFVVLPYVLTQMGKLSVLSDVDVEEWKRPPAAVMVRSALEQVRPGSVMQFHDPLGEETLKAVDQVVTRLLAQGYRFERISELIKRRPNP